MIIFFKYLVSHKLKKKLKTALVNWVYKMGYISPFNLFSSKAASFFRYSYLPLKNHPVHT